MPQGATPTPPVGSDKVVDFFAAVPTGKDYLGKDFYSVTPSPLRPVPRQRQSLLKDFSHPMPTPETAALPLASRVVRKAGVVPLGLALIGALGEISTPDGRINRVMRRLGLKKGNKVGSGSVADVYQVATKIGKSDIETALAVKVLTKEATRNKKNRERFQAEMEIQAKLIHPNIVRVYHTVMEGDPMVLVTEFCTEGRLLKYLQMGRNHIKEVSTSEERITINYDQAVDIRQVTMDVARALEYLHGKEIIHGDVKSANIMLTRSPGQMVTAKLCDFGSAERVGDKGHRDLLSDAELGSSGIKELPAGTLLWMPPELLDIKMLDNPLCLANDIFSFGMVMYELLIQGIPWTYAGAVTPKGREEVYQMVIEERQRPFIPTWVPYNLTKLLAQCWQHNPADRPSIAEVIAELEDIPADDWEFIQKCAYHDYKMTTIKGSGASLYPAVSGEWKPPAVESAFEPQTGNMREREKAAGLKAFEQSGFF